MNVAIADIDTVFNNFVVSMVVPAIALAEAT